MLSAARLRLVSTFSYLSQVFTTNLLVLSLAFIIAVLVGNFAPSLQGLIKVILALAAIALTALVLALNRRAAPKKAFSSFAPQILKWTMLISLGGFLGTLHTFLAWQQHLNNKVPLFCLNKTIMAEGYIVGLPKIYQDHAQFNFKLQRLDAATASHTVQLNWYFVSLEPNKNIKALPSSGATTPKLSAGDYWRFQIRLKPPVAPINQGGLDREKLWASQGVSAIGSVVPNYFKPQLLDIKPHFGQVITRWRQAAIKNTVKQLEASEALLKRCLPRLFTLDFHTCRAIILSLILGYREDLDHLSWRVINFAGIGHLLAISGMHISLIATIITRLTKLLMPARWLIYCPRPKVAAVTSFVFSLAYATITGWSIATERALGMLMLNNLAILMDRKITSLTSLGVTLVAVLLVHPMAPLQVGFWLSFSAALLMILFGFWQNFNKDAAFNGFKLFWLQLRLFLTLTPLNFSFFQKISLLSITTNLVAIPIITLVVLPLAITSLALQLFRLSAIARLGYALALGSLQLLWQGLSAATLAFGELFTLSYSFSNLPLALLAIFTALMALGFYRLSFFRLGWVAAAIAVLSWPNSRAPHSGEFHASVIDVGQGLAVLVSTQHHAMLFDTGPSSLNSDSAKRYIIPFMLAKHLKALDVLVVSHGDNDHAGGAKSIIKYFKPRKILTSAPKALNLAPKKASSALTLCKAGQYWKWDEVSFKVLHPDVKTLSDPNTSANNGSCVIKVSSHNKALLLTGDIEQLSEYHLVTRLGHEAREVLGSDVLIAPHHGSKTSSTIKFIQAVKPKVVVFTTSYRNRFHFPHALVLERYKMLLPKAKLFNSAYTGTLTLKFTKQALIAIPFRQTTKRLWRAFSEAKVAPVAW